MRLFRNRPTDRNTRLNIHKQTVKYRAVSPDLNENIATIEDLFFHTQDLKKRKLHFHGRKGIILYIESLIDKSYIDLHIIRPLMETQKTEIEQIITATHVNTETNLEQIAKDLIQAKAVLFFEQSEVAYVVEAALVIKREVKEPDNEGVVRGSHEGFIENLTVNLHLIRNRLENHKLKVRYYQLGTESNTRVAMVYLEDLANPDIILKVEERLLSVSVDTLISPGFLADFIEDNPYSPFPQLLYTERPDRVVSNLMEGRAALFTEGDPTAIVVPVSLFSFYQSPDDYHSRWMIGSFVRLIRLASFLIAFQLPALYIAIIAFHPEMLPSELVLTVKKSVERVPYPPIMEAFLMELTMELIREAGIRLPSRVGQTIGIVGGLVIGDAVVKAGLVSLPMVIVVSLTAISSYVVPSQEMSTTIRILRFPLMVATAMFGFIGMSFGLALILIHLCKLESFGTPYFSPIMPLRFRDLRDTFVRFPMWNLNQRPHSTKPQRYVQQRFSREWEKDDKK
jgi:spore germination protein KA